MNQITIFYTGIYGEGFLLHLALEKQSSLKILLCFLKIGSIVNLGQNSMALLGKAHQ